MIAGVGLSAMGLLTSPAAAADPPAQLVLSGTARDFDSAPKVNAAEAHPDFANKSGDDRGIVEPTLGTDDKPVYGSHASTKTTAGKAQFDQWYRDVDGVNRSVPVTLTADRIPDSNPPQYRYSNTTFFPVDGKGWNDPAVGDGVGQVKGTHNYSFTFELHRTFNYAGGETFRFEGDDDLWVFINGRLAIDLGGVHTTESSTVNLDAKAAELGLTKGGTYKFDLFFAERMPTASVFTISTSLQLGDAPLSTSDPGSSSSSSSVPSSTTPTAIAAVSGATTSTTVRSGMPVTGAHSQVMTVVGLELLGVGLLLVGQSLLRDPRHRTD
jgi:fibro-slime domain-containing protein